MSSERDIKLNRYRAIRAYKMKQEGMTHRQIAVVLEMKSTGVKGLVLLGERLVNDPQ